jgi:hypothetical protein
MNLPISPVEGTNINKSTKTYHKCSLECCRKTVEKKFSFGLGEKKSLEIKIFHKKTKNKKHLMFKKLVY